MNADRLLEHYGKIADAPDPIPRLRRFVLDLAVRGKLVPQDPNDEPASELLKRIAIENAQIVHSRKMRGSSGQPKVPNSTLTSRTPVGWVQTTVGAVSRIVMGQSPPGDTYNNRGDGVPLINGPVEFSAGPFGRTIVNQYTTAPTNFCEENDLLLCVRGSTTGRTNVAGSRACIGRGVAAIQSRFQDSFLRLYLWSKRDSIIEMGRGIAFPSVSRRQIEELPFPLPPLAEQHRIVAKVDELMALCDRLEAARAVRETIRDRLTAASLARLNAPDPDSFRGDTRFALDALPALTARADQIKQLRQTILNLAVHGKLLAQDPEDEPALKLLKNRFKLPQGFSRRRKIIKAASVDASEGLLSELPETWASARIQDLYDANIVIDYADGNHGSLYPRSSEFGDEGVVFVSAKDLVGGKVNWATCSKLNRERASQLTKGWAQTGDVLLTHNATVGRVAKVVERVEPFLLGTSVTFYRLNKNALSPDYFFIVLQSPIWQRQLEAIMAQTTRNQVSIQKQAFFRIPLPPLSEQLRIVAMVDGLMALCDRLEASLTVAAATRGRLLDALLAEALAPGDERELEAAE